MDCTDFWYRGFLPSILHCVIRKFGYSKNKGTSPLPGNLSKMLDLEFHQGSRSHVSALDKSIGMTTMDCFSHVAQVRHTAWHVGREPTLSLRLISRPCIARSIGDSWYLSSTITATISALNTVKLSCYCWIFALLYSRLTILKPFSGEPIFRLLSFYYSICSHHCWWLCNSNGIWTVKKPAPVIPKISFGVPGPTWINFRKEGRWNYN